MSFSVASYNVLADAYINPAWYPGVPASILDPESRGPALVEHVAELATEVICLQEVESGRFVDLERRLRPMGYEGRFAVKNGGKPDGCATFIRSNTFILTGVFTLHYADGSGAAPPSGHLALGILLEHLGRSLAVVNTHLKWDAPGTPTASQRGFRQITELLEDLGTLSSNCPSWIIVGDFNVVSDSSVVKTLRAAGFVDAYQNQPTAYTCNPNRRARRIDYLFHTADLRARPVDLPRIYDHTPLPSRDEPSDHLAVAAEFDWAE